MLVVLVATFGMAVGIGMAATNVFASHDDPATIHACVSRSTGAARIVTDPEQCTRYERLVEWQSGETDTSGLETRIAALEDRLSRYRRHLVADQKALADARSAWAAAAAAESPASVEG